MSLLHNPQDRYLHSQSVLSTQPFWHTKGSLTFCCLAGTQNNCKDGFLYNSTPMTIFLPFYQLWQNEGNLFFSFAITWIQLSKRFWNKQHLIKMHACWQIWWDHWQKYRSAKHQKIWIFRKGYFQGNKPVQMQKSGGIRLWDAIKHTAQSLNLAFHPVQLLSTPDLISELTASLQITF